MISGSRAILPGSHRTGADSEALLLVGPRGGFQNRPHFAANRLDGSLVRLSFSWSTCFRAPTPDDKASLAIAPVGPARMGDLQQPQP
jgi:outer membrane receptor protein involved in Fe transport